MVSRDVRHEFFREFVEVRAVVAPHPTRRHDADALEDGFDAVLVAQAIRRNLELQRTDGPEDQVVADGRPKQLRGPFLA